MALADYRCANCGHNLFHHDKTAQARAFGDTPWAKATGCNARVLTEQPEPLPPARVRCGCTDYQKVEVATA